MPDADEHSRQIQHNKKFLDTFINPYSDTIYCDWAITVTFYSLLHLVELYFNKKGGDHYFNHEERNEAIRFDDNLESIYKDYHRLYDWSRGARYKCFQFSPDEVEEAHERLPYVENIINTIIQDPSFSQ